MANTGSDVLVLITDPADDALSDAGREALGLALQLAADLGGTVSLACAGDPASGAATEAAEHGAARVYAITDDSARPRGDLLLAGAAAAAGRIDAGVVVVSRGPLALEVA